MQEMSLEWVTIKGNRYDLPVHVDDLLETEPLFIDGKLGTGHLELTVDGHSRAITHDMEPPNDPIVVNIRLELLVREPVVSEE